MMSETARGDSGQSFDAPEVETQLAALPIEVPRAQGSA